MNYVKSALAIAIYVLLLVVTYFIYINLMKVDVLFYSSIYSVLIALAFFSILLFRFSFFATFSGLEKTQNILIAGLIGYALAISIPTVIDRSLSFYILEKLQQRHGAIKLSKFNYIFTNEYMREYRLVDIRLTEQVASGTIIINGDCVRLTPRGDKLATFSRMFRQRFLPKQRLLRSEYTDQLIDPFNRSDKSPDYLCD